MERKGGEGRKEDPRECGLATSLSKIDVGTVMCKNKRLQRSVIRFE